MNSDHSVPDPCLSRQRIYKIPVIAFQMNDPLRSIQHAHCHSLASNEVRSMTAITIDRLCSIFQS